MDQGYGDTRREYDHFEHRPSQPVAAWSDRAYEHETTTNKES